MTKDFAKVCQTLRDIFDERKSQHRQRKLACYKRHQESHESLRVLVLSQQDIVDTIVENALPQAGIAFKGHLFKTVNDLLKSGLISENCGEPAQESTLKILMEEVRPLRLERQQQATTMPPTVKVVTFAEPGTQYNGYQGNGFQGSYQRQSRPPLGNYRAPYHNANMSVSGWKTDMERKNSHNFNWRGQGVPDSSAQWNQSFLQTSLQGPLRMIQQSEDKLFNRKRDLYSIPQASGQPFTHYLQVLQETALDMGVDLGDLVKTVIARAQQVLKPYLAGTTATLID